MQGDKARSTANKHTGKQPQAPAQWSAVGKDPKCKGRLVPASTVVLRAGGWLWLRLPPAFGVWEGGLWVSGSFGMVWVVGQRFGV